MQLRRAVERAIGETATGTGRLLPVPAGLLCPGDPDGAGADPDRHRVLPRVPDRDGTAARALWSLVLRPATPDHGPARAARPRIPAGFLSSEQPRLATWGVTVTVTADPGSI